MWEQGSKGNQPSSDSKKKRKIDNSEEKKVIKRESNIERFESGKNVKQAKLKTK